MKLLHTSDWHLGHTLYNYDRVEEQQSMMSQMISIVSEQKPDLFLLCGDVYHTSQPSSAVQTMFTDFLVQLHDANPQMHIIVTAGNHDSATKHEIFRTPWRSMKVHTIGTLNKENIFDHIIKIGDKGYVLAVPYANTRNIPEGFFQNLLDEVNSQNRESLPVVLTAHTTVKGCDYMGHSNATEFSVGGIDTLDIEELGLGYDYLALGHIHHQQYVHTGKHNVRYSGSPLAVSFDEAYPHTVTMVDIEKHGAVPVTTQIEITNPRPLVTLPTEGVATWADVKTLLSNYPADIPAYIRLNVEIENFLSPNANAEAVALTKDKECRFCYINAKLKNSGGVETKVMTIQELKSEAPIDIARQYAKDKGIIFDETMQTLFQEALGRLNEELRNE
ncbi:MAG: exonuclease subunit SbcD [Bacteroidales bacterium]|nr:exonuclease subunit SbcD [Bacteroidales bacterium]